MSQNTHPRASYASLAFLRVDAVWRSHAQCYLSCCTQQSADWLDSEAGDSWWFPCSSCARPHKLLLNVLQPLYVLHEELWLPLSLHPCRVSVLHGGAASLYCQLSRQPGRAACEGHIRECKLMHWHLPAWSLTHGRPRFQTWHLSPGRTGTRRRTAQRLLSHPPRPATSCTGWHSAPRKHHQPQLRQPT